jgi:hypothetical protein
MRKWCMSVIPALGKLRQEYLEFQARPCPKKKKKPKEKKGVKEGKRRGRERKEGNKRGGK